MKAERMKPGWTQKAFSVARAEVQQLPASLQMQIEREKAGMIQIEDDALPLDRPIGKCAWCSQVIETDELDDCRLVGKHRDIVVHGECAEQMYD